MQHLVKFMCHFLWQVQHLVMFMCHFSWQAQHSVKFNIYIYTFHLTWWKNCNELPDSPFRLPAALLAEVPFCTLPDRVRFGGIVTYYWTAGCKKCKVRKTDDRWSRSLDGYWCTRTLWLLYQIHVRKCPKANGLVGDCWLEEAVLFPQVGHTAQPSRSKLMLKKWWLIRDTLFECIQNHPTCRVGDGWGSNEKRQTPSVVKTRPSWWTFWYIHRHVF